MVVCTSTASGKSLCYALPIIEALARDPAACALLMFPTKALAQDQLRALRRLCAAALGPTGPSVDVYDGDTPQACTDSLPCMLCTGGGCVCSIAGSRCSTSCTEA